MKIYIVRHGQTKCNVENKYNCRLDEDINEMGIEEAKQAREKVKKLNIDLIICSPMKRTKHTCEIINANNIPVIYDDRLPDLFKRTHSFLDEIKEKYYDKNILLVTHGAVARAMQFYFEELPEDGMLLNVSGQENCEIKEYEL